MLGVTLFYHNIFIVALNDLYFNCMVFVFCNKHVNGQVGLLIFNFLFIEKVTNKKLFDRY